MFDYTLNEKVLVYDKLLNFFQINSEGGFRKNFMNILIIENRIKKDLKHSKLKYENKFISKALIESLTPLVLRMDEYDRLGWSLGEKLYESDILEFKSSVPYLVYKALQDINNFIKANKSDYPDIWDLTFYNSEGGNIWEDGLNYKLKDDQEEDIKLWTTESELELLVSSISNDNLEKSKSELNKLPSEIGYLAKLLDAKEFIKEASNKYKEYLDIANRTQHDISVTSIENNKMKREMYRFDQSVKEYFRCLFLSELNIESFIVKKTEEINNENDDYLPF